MWKYVLKRIGLLIFTFSVIFVMCFFLIKLLPNEVAETFGKDKEIIMYRREMLGYNKPYIEQLFIMIKRIFLYNDWGVGEEMYPTREVWEVFTSKLPPTMLINFYSMLISVPLGLGLGIFAALKKNKWQDHVISISVMIFISVPSYIYAFLVQYIFCYKLKLFPILMDDGTDWFSASMTLSMMPAIISLSFGTIAGLTRYTRAELTEVLTSEFMLLARTKGLTRAQATTRHALRNSMVPIFPSILAEFIGIIGGSLIIEKLFGVPGVGQLYLTSINAKDYNFFMLLTAFYTAIGLLSGIVIDLSYGFIDPRIRMGAR